MKKSFPVDKVMYEIYISLRLSIEQAFKRNTTIEKFFSKYKYFRYYGEYFIFTKDKNDEGMEQLMINPFWIIIDGVPTHVHRPLFVYKIIFPFMVFGLDITQENDMSSWYSSQLLLDLLPTRKNIITNILKDLNEMT